jgi:spore coat protein CotH
MLLNRIRALAVVTILAAGVPAVSLAQTPTPVAAPDPADRFFDDSVLHDIYVAINSRDWQALRDHFLDNTYYPCDFRWNDQVVRNIGIRSRGVGSRSGLKPGLRVDFNRYTTGQKFLGLKSFILRNNTQDPSGMRERLSMLFFRRMGVKAVREAHARLFVNNAYAGLYTIVESVDKDFLAKNFDEDSGHLYSYQFDNAAPVPFTFGYLGTDPALYVPAPFKPETLDTDPQGEVIERLLWTVNVAGDAIWRTAMEEFLDLKKFIRYLAIENFLADEDGLTGDYGPNNFYLYRFANKNLFTFIPWDKSNTFWATPNYSIFHNIEDGPESRRNRLVLRALRSPDLRELYLNTILECADSILEGSAAIPPLPPTPTPTPTVGWLEAEIQREADRIRPATYADPAREVYTNADFDESIRFLTNWAQTRSAIVRAQVAAARATRGIR